MGLTKPLIHEIAYKTWLVNELGCNNMYVLEGTERSLVIDAGMGYCEFRKIVESLTDKPYEVVITHAHPDHIGMMHQFDRIYINKKEITDADPMPVGGIGPDHPSRQEEAAGGMSTIEWLTRPDFNMEQFDFNKGMHIGNWEVWTPTEDVICRGNLDTEIRFIDEGMAFDLGGGRVVTGYNLPGHSPGHMYFVDSGARIAYTGDCVNYNNGTMYHAASTHIRYLMKLLSMYGTEYDRIFTGHTTFGGSLDVKSMDIGVVENLIEAHRAFLRGDEQYEEISFSEEMNVPPVKKIVYGEGETRVEIPIPPKKWEDGEEHIIP